MRDKGLDLICDYLGELNHCVTLLGEAGKVIEFKEASIDIEK